MSAGIPRFGENKGAYQLGVVGCNRRGVTTRPGSSSAATRPRDRAIRLIGAGWGYSYPYSLTTPAFNGEKALYHFTRKDRFTLAVGQSMRLLSTVVGKRRFTHTRIQREVVLLKILIFPGRLRTCASVDGCVCVSLFWIEHVVVVVCLLTCVFIFMAVSRADRLIELHHQLSL